MRTKWGNRLIIAIDEFMWGRVDELQFRGNLVGLAVPDGYIDWLIFMLKRGERK
jgi:hypothetical protein